MNKIVCSRIKAELFNHKFVYDLSFQAYHEALDFCNDLAKEDKLLTSSIHLEIGSLYEYTIKPKQAETHYLHA